MNGIELRRRVVRLLLLIGLGGSLAFPSSGPAQEPTLSPELAAVRAALAKYQDFQVAVRDGYFSTVGCVHYP